DPVPRRDHREGRGLRTRIIDGALIQARRIDTDYDIASGADRQRGPAPHHGRRDTGGAMHESAGGRTSSAVATPEAQQWIAPAATDRDRGPREGGPVIEPLHEGSVALLDEGGVVQRLLRRSDGGSVDVLVHGGGVVGRDRDVKVELPTGKGGGSPGLRARL